MIRIFKHPRFPLWYLWINSTLIIGGLLIIAYLLFIDGSNPLRIEDTVNGEVATVEPMFDGGGNFVNKTTFKTGEPVAVGVTYCKNRNVPATIHARFVDTAIIDMPDAQSNVPSGCGKVIIDDFRVPKLLPTGKYYLKLEIEYQVNPLRTVRVPFRTVDFQIINTSK